MEVVGEIWTFLQDRVAKGETPIALYGARRSSKTWTIAQFFLNRAFNYGEKCIIASMTETQGDAGAYEDCQNIVRDNPAWSPYFVVTRSPRKLICRFARGNRNGQLYFRAFKDADTAKGAACDWIYINEANKFTLKQYYTITANARKGVILDYNPEEHRFWAEDIVKSENILRCKWQWNRRHLTPAILQWFEDLKRRGTAPDATSADKAFYRRYYCGEYADIYGDVFTPANIIREQVDSTRLRFVGIVADPSNLTGADFFATVCVATDGARLYVLDALSVNTSDVPAAVTNWEAWCKRWQPILERWRAWRAQHGAQMIFCEANGVGAEFLRYARSEGWAVRPFQVSANKHKRILDNYDVLTSRVVWHESENVDAYLQQVYAFTGKEQADIHDDNIDCVSSAVDIYYRHTRMMQQQLNNKNDGNLQKTESGA